MNLDTALTEIAAFLDLDAAKLIAYAAEDTVGGFDFNESKSKWPAGSLWEVEGKALYALTRALRPKDPVEFGVYRGCSTTHILSAIYKNAYADLTSVDIWEGAGELVPKPLHDRWLLEFTEATQWLCKQPSSHYIDLAFEDCIHSESEVYAIVEALKPKLRKGAVVVHHDSEHGNDGVKVRAGLDRAGVKYKSWLIEPSDCGIAIWRAE